jgi:hypothetical protein
MQGSTGAQGTSGTNGINGTQGTTGSQGTIGTQGSTGATGNTGAQGTTGLQGLTGSTGIQGATGTQGTTGTTGDTGIQGTTGTQGATGTQGLQGRQGTTGLQGVQGVQGRQGTTGLQGTQGIQGPSSTSATTISTVIRETAAAHYLVFVDSNNVSGAQESVYTDAGAQYNPSTDALEINGSIRTTTGSLGRGLLASGGSTGATFDNSGNLIRTTSSERYKQDIQDASYLYEEILALNPKSFKLIEEVSSDPNARRYAGFIAEDIAGTGLDIFVSYQTLPDGTKRPDGVYYAELTSALVDAIKHQDGLIKALEARIKALEDVTT